MSANLDVRVNGQSYRRFQLRGEGLSSFAVSAVREDGQKIVWRFRKDKTRLLCSVSSDAEHLVQYIENVIAPLLGLLRQAHVTIPKVANFDLPSLRNLFRTGELKEYFPENFVRPSITALEMPNFTILDQIPGNYPSISVEIKPKQGFMSEYFIASGLRSPFCTNCLLQTGKVQAGAYLSMYDFCPLDLFSGQLERMKYAIKSLLRIPHKNLQIVENGQIIFSEEYRTDEAFLANLIFSEGEGTMEDFVHMMCRVLAGCVSTDSKVPFHLDADSVLSRLLTVQRLDSIGLIEAANFYKSLPEDLRLELRNPYVLFELDNPERYKSLLANLSPETLIKLRFIRGYMVAATVKDCSVMVTFKRMASDSHGCERRQMENCMDTKGVTYLNVKLASNPNVAYAVDVQVIDLDVKQPKKLEANRQRLIDSLKFVEGFAEDFKALRRPCVV